MMIIRFGHNTNATTRPTVEYLQRSILPMTLLQGRSSGLQCSPCRVFIAVRWVSIPAAAAGRDPLATVMGSAVTSTVQF